MGEAFGEASAHRAQPFERLSLRLLPHALIPNHQAVLSGLRPLLERLSGSLPQEVGDEPGSPFAGVRADCSSVWCPAFALSGVSRYPPSSESSKPLARSRKRMITSIVCRKVRTRRFSSKLSNDTNKGN